MRPRTQAPRAYFHNRTTRTPWRVVMSVDGERYTVDGVDGTYDDVLPALRDARERRSIVRRLSDGAPLTVWSSAGDEL